MTDAFDVISKWILFSDNISMREKKEYSIRIVSISIPSINRIEEEKKWKNIETIDWLTWDYRFTINNQQISTESVQFVCISNSSRKSICFAHISIISWIGHR